MPSLNPEHAVEGGGLLDDVDAAISKARFVMWDYQGAAREESPAMCLTLDLDGDTHEQYYSMGSAKDWMASEDGKTLVAVGKLEGIRSSTNGMVFLTALVDAGFPAEKLDDGDITVLDGLEAHFVQVPAPERKGLKKTKEQQEKEEKYGPKTILVISEVKRLPWEKKTPAGKKTPKKAATKKGKETKKADPKPAEDSGSGDVAEVATNFVLGVLAEEGSIDKKKLPPKAFQVLNKKVQAGEDLGGVTPADVVSEVFKDEFLANGPWSYDKDTGTVSM